MRFPLFARLLFAVFLFLSPAMLSAAPPVKAERPGFTAFFQKFATAVAKKDKAALAAMTAYPLAMPYGYGAIKNASEFRRRYDELFTRETDAKRCFSSQAPLPDPADPKRYDVACDFKEAPDDKAMAPFLYRFARTKAGWKFTGFDNINE